MVSLMSALLAERLRAASSIQALSCVLSQRACLRSAPTSAISSGTTFGIGLLSAASASMAAASRRLEP